MRVSSDTWVATRRSAREAIEERDDPAPVAARAAGPRGRGSPAPERFAEAGANGSSSSHSGSRRRRSGVQPDQRHRVERQPYERARRARSRSRARQAGWRAPRASGAGRPPAAGSSSRGRRPRAPGCRAPRARARRSPSRWWPGTGAPRRRSSKGPSARELVDPPGEQARLEGAPGRRRRAWRRRRGRRAGVEALVPAPARPVDHEQLDGRRTCAAAPRARPGASRSGS